MTALYASANSASVGSILGEVRATVDRDRFLQDIAALAEEFAFLAREIDETWFDLDAETRQKLIAVESRMEFQRKRVGLGRPHGLRSWIDRTIGWLKRSPSIVDEQAVLNFAFAFGDFRSSLQRKQAQQKQIDEAVLAYIATPEATEAVSRGRLQIDSGLGNHYTAEEFESHFRFG